MPVLDKSGAIGDAAANGRCQTDWESLMRKVLFAAAVVPAAILSWTAAGANPPAPQPKPADECHHDDGHHGGKSTDDHKCEHHDGKPAGEHH